MLHPDVRQEIIRQEGDAASRATGDTTTEVDFRDAAWQRWLEDTAILQDAGFPPAQMCDSINTVATIRAEVGERIAAA